MNKSPRQIEREVNLEIDYFELYIALILRMAGITLPPLYLGILAASGFYGNLEKETKQIILSRYPSKNATSTQVISNAITALRKKGFLIGSILSKSLQPPEIGRGVLLNISIKKPLNGSSQTA